MTISIHQALVPVAIRNLNNLSEILKKAEAYAEVKKIEPSVLINARLFPDMLPLARQIQIACDTVKAGAARLAEIPVPSHPDVEQTFSELRDRINTTISFLQTIQPEQINGKDELKISYVAHGRKRKFIGLLYLLSYLLPNLYFHITTAYAILRHNGLEIGKKDYLGRE